MQAVIHTLQKKIARRGINYDLTRLNEALSILNQPHQQLPLTVHIAGTNGKGSVAHYIHQAMIANGKTSLMVTSPHIHSYCERFMINGDMISESLFSELFYQVNIADQSDDLSEYEVLTLMAFLLAKNTQPDILILETGLGGRLDATNVIQHSISVITDIGMDHMDILGTSIEDIAAEKAGIIKPKSTVVTHSDHTESVFRIINDQAINQQATLISPNAISSNFHERNKALAICACEQVFELKGYSKTSLYETILNLKPPFGRFSKTMYQGQSCWVDVGHNLAAIQAIFQQLNSDISYDWIIGMQAKKDMAMVVDWLLKHQQKVSVCEFDQSAFKINDLPVKHVDLINKWRIGMPINEGAIFFGSFYFIEALITDQLVIQ